jgi:hypothetical protein
MMHVRQVLMLVLALGLAACGGVTDEESGFGIPERDGPPDLSAVTDQLRTEGGVALIGLTAPATEAVLRDLGETGVTDLSAFTFSPTVRGTIEAGGVYAVAERPYVVRIEPDPAS